MYNNKGRREEQKEQWQEENLNTENPDPKQLLQSLMGRMEGTSLSESFDVFIDLRIATGFDLVFNQPKGQKFLIEMINAFLPQGVASVKRLSPVLQAKTISKEAASNKFDFNYKDDRGRLIVFDLQKNFVSNYKNDTVNKLSKVAIAWLQERAAKEKEPLDFPVIGFGLVDFMVNDKSQDNCLKIVDENRQLLPSDNLDTNQPLLLIAELNKTLITKDVLAGLNEKYLYLLANLGRLQQVPDGFKASDLSVLFELARLAERTEADKQCYTQAVFDQVILESQLAASAKGLFKNGVKQSFLLEVSRSVDKRSIQRFTCCRLHQYSPLKLDEIADIVELSLDEVKGILLDEGLKLNE